MSTAVAVRKSPISVRTISFLLALVSVFFLGGAGGYIVKRITTSALAAGQPGTLCPPGTHVFGWQTAPPWTCKPPGPAIACTGKAFPICSAGSAGHGKSELDHRKEFT